jgi:hypothetical protein
MKDNNEMLIYPIFSEGRPTAVLLLFDKFSGFRRIDFIIAMRVSRAIGELLPVLHQLARRKVVVDRFQETLHALLNVVNATDFAAFQSEVRQTFTSRFRCLFVNIFRVSQKSKTFCDLEKLLVNCEHFPLETSIVGTALQSKLSSL